LRRRVPDKPMIGDTPSVDNEQPRPANRNARIQPGLATLQTSFTEIIEF
jgi:hypothetical protein